MQFQKAKAVTRLADRADRETWHPFECKRCWSKKTDALVGKVVDMALAGNIGALRLCLDRLAPTRKNEPLFCEMPPLQKASDAVAAIAGVASAAAAGDVTADEAAKLAKVISLYVNTLEAHDFEDRLARLEHADLKRVRDMSHASNDAPRAET